MASPQYQEIPGTELKSLYLAEVQTVNGPQLDGSTRLLSPEAATAIFEGTISLSDDNSEPLHLRERGTSIVVVVLHQDIARSSRRPWNGTRWAT